MKLLCLSVLLVLLVQGYADRVPIEGILNSDFEEAVDYGEPWYCSGCVGSQSFDAYEGNFSMLAVDRRSAWSGPRQVLKDVLQLNKLYFFSLMVKLLETDGNANDVDMKMSIGYELFKDDGGIQRKYESIIIRHVAVEDGWVKLAAEYQLTDYQLEINEVFIYIETNWATDTLPRQQFMVDEFQGLEILLQDEEQWREEVLDKISEARTSNLTISVRSGSTTPVYEGELTLEIEQLESEFGFGTSVDGFLLTSHDAYRDAFLDNFHWGVLDQDMSWQETEYSKNLLTWESADAAMYILEAHNKRVRGGVVHETDKDLFPDFAGQVESPDDIYRYSMKRVDDLLGRYRYRCEHWDVVNNMFDGENFLSDIFGSDKINADLYKRSKEVDYAAKLFLNHNNLLESSSQIQNVVDKVISLRSQGVSVDGIGIHAVFEEAPNGILIVDRLDRLAEAGVPIWITGYSFAHPDEVERATALDDFMMAVSSQPLVGGVMLLDFWDGHSARGNTALFAGNDFTPNAVGIAWQSIYQHASHTDEILKTFTFGPGDSFEMPPLNLYHGVYSVRIRRSDGYFRKNERVSLLKHQGDKEIVYYI